MRSEGSSRSEPARRGRLSFARTCIRYLRERILYSVNTNTRRQDGLIVVLLTHLGNAVGVFNEGKSSRADSECGFSFFGEAKKSKCPAGMKRMVKTTPQANHKAPTHFQAASHIILPPNTPTPLTKQNNTLFTQNNGYNARASDFGVIIQHDSNASIPRILQFVPPNVPSPVALSAAIRV